LRELAGEIDAAIVAVPTVAHGSVVGVALEAGLDVLVEKPIAASVEGQRCWHGHAPRAQLQVGHLRVQRRAREVRAG
jgi:predicted dehydrogenase